MTEEERYLFDLQGYLVVKNAIDADTLAVMNAWIDAQAAQNPTWRAQPHKTEIANVLTWGKPFLDLFANARVLPYLKELLGDHLRLDHDYAVFLQPGAKPLWLHGGGTPFDPSQYFLFRNGKMFNGLLVAAYALTDVPPGQGGFACILGSHKSNYACPSDIMRMQRESPIVQQVPVQAGDCVVFTEALAHGTLPWTGDHDRRTIFFKYSPGHMTWASRYYFAAEGDAEVQALEPELTERQRALLDPPSIDRHRRVP